MSSDRLGGRKTLVVEGFLEEFEKDEIKGRVGITLLFASFGVILKPGGKVSSPAAPGTRTRSPLSRWTVSRGCITASAAVRVAPSSPWCRSSAVWASRRPSHT